MTDNGRKNPHRHSKTSLREGSGETLASYP
jgi:hypothetical protein